MLAVGYAFQEPALHFWWVWVGWALILACGVERLILQLPMTRSWPTLALSLTWRVSLSLLLALLLSEPLILRLNQDEIQTQLQQENQTAIRQAKEKVQDYYNGRITKAQKELQHTRHSLKTAQHNFSRELRAEAGCLGGSCTASAEEVHNLGKNLHAVEHRNARRQPELHERLADARGNLSKAEVKEEKAVDKGNGLLARIGALSGVTEKDPNMKYEVWTLRFLFLFLDLLPLIARIFHTFRNGAAPYDERLAARWRQDALPAKAEEAHADVEEHRIEEQARAEMEVDRARIMFDADRRVAEAGEANGEADASGLTVDTAPVSAWRLRDFVDAMEPHEAQAVDVDPELRKNGLIGTGLIAALAMLATLWSALTHQAVAGMWLIVIALCVAVALTFFTQGFRRAPAWGLQAIYVIFFIGLVLPVVIIGINL
jgi:hypothetical protein